MTERFPRVEGRAILSCDDIRPIGNRWKTGTEGIIVCQGFGGKSIDVGCFYPVISVCADIVVAECIDNNVSEIHF